MSEITETIDRFIESFVYEFEAEPLCDVPDIFFNFKEDMCKLIAKFEYDVMEDISSRNDYFNGELHIFFDEIKRLSHD